MIWAIVAGIVGAIVAYVVGRLRGAQKQVVDAAVKQAAASSKAVVARDAIAERLEDDVKKTHASTDQALVDELNADFAAAELRHKTPKPSPK